MVSKSLQKEASSGYRSCPLRQLGMNWTKEVSDRPRGIPILTIVLLSPPDTSWRLLRLWTPGWGWGVFFFFFFFFVFFVLGGCGVWGVIFLFLVGFGLCGVFFFFVFFFFFFLLGFFFFFFFFWVCVFCVFGFVLELLFVCCVGVSFCFVFFFFFARGSGGGVVFFCCGVFFL